MVKIYENWTEKVSCDIWNFQDFDKTLCRTSIWIYIMQIGELMSFPHNKSKWLADTQNY